MKDKIKEIMARIFEARVDQITDETNPETLEQWDSLHHLYLVLALEEEFGITFSEDEIVELLNIEVIEQKLKSKGAA